jgi:predicted Zn-dependent protease
MDDMIAGRSPAAGAGGPSAQDRPTAPLTLRTLFNLSGEFLQACSSKAYDYYKEKRYVEAELVSRWLVATDHRNWFYRTLVAACLQKQGRVPDAIAEVDEGLKFEPGHADLLALKAVLLELPAARDRAAKP